MLMTSAVRAFSMRLPQRPRDSIALLGLEPGAGRPVFYWSRDDGLEQVAALGSVSVIVAGGPDRWRTISELSTAVSRTACGSAEVGSAGVGPGESAFRARWVGGFAFEDGWSSDRTWAGFPPALWFLPEVQLVTEGDAAWLTVAGSHSSADELRARALAIASALDRQGADQRSGHIQGPGIPGADGDAGHRRHAQLPSRALLGIAESAATEARERAKAAIDRISAGNLEKAVVAISRTVPMNAPLDSRHVLARLRAREPGCFHFLVSPEPGVALVGASPERLVRCEGDRLRTVALAGSAGRSPDPARDDELGAQLLASGKDRAEHEVVVSAIRSELSLLGGDVLVGDAPPAPRLRRLATVQHLETPIEARVAARRHVLEAAGRLHPTPALAGAPKGVARRAIAEIEARSRGWYGGAAGWIDAAGQGDLTVIIRSLLIRRHEVTAYAGAGIVAGSDANAEAGEIVLKLMAALAALA
jgi:menaquinone-specific isochorismate synthase